MKQRITGFDVARAYAVFGMLVVNFNFAFGVFGNNTLFRQFENLFVGNSTSIFIMLAGIGLSLMRGGSNSTAEQKLLRSVVLRRSWFLFATGLLLYSWWPGDILHFYGGYMHIAAFLLFVPRRYYLVTACCAIAVFHILLFIIPVNTGWSFDTTRYIDFWTIKGFLRNTLYNGWNSMFPWFAYFMAGMWLGRLDWNNAKTKRNIFLWGMGIFTFFQLLRVVARNNMFDERVTQYIMSEYFPPYLPFMAITAGYAMMVITACVYIAERLQGKRIIQYLATAGRMTLTHYIIHLTAGMLLLSWFSGKRYTGYWHNGVPVSPVYIFLFAAAFFIMQVVFSVVWSQRFSHGPVEWLMRKFSDGQWRRGADH